MQIVKKYLKNYLILLEIGEMKVKLTIRYYHMPGRRIINEKTKISY